MKVQNHVSYRVRLGGPNLMVLAPDKDLTRYKIKHFIETNAQMTPPRLFSTILSRINGMKAKGCAIWSSSAMAPLAS